MFHGMYGIWTQYNMIRYYHLDKACKAVKCMSMNNYIVIILLGVGPALLVALITLFILVLIPMIIYSLCRLHRQRTEDVRRLNRLRSLML